jgi:LysR family transcriptional regulator, transcriptional activator of the cysJI operon
MLNIFDHHKLQILIKTVETESIAQVAKHFNVTSSAISQTIKLLEDQLQKQLFMRVGKKLKPTAITHELCRVSGSYFYELEKLLESDIFQGVELRLGTPYLWGTCGLTDHLADYLKENKKVKCLVSFRSTHQLVAGVKNGEYDFAFVDEGPMLKEFPEIVTKKIAQEELVLCCSKEFKRSEGLTQNSSFQDFSSKKHILYHKGKEGVYKWYLHHYNKVPELDYSMTLDHPLAILKAMLKGLGLTVLPRAYLSEQGVLDKVFIIEGAKKTLISKILLAQLADKVPSSHQKSLIEFLFSKYCPN